MGNCRGLRWDCQYTLFFWRQVYKNSVVFDFDCVSVEVLSGGSAQHFAGADIEAGTVPGTGDDAVGEFALIEGAADMRAVVGKGVDGAVNICEADWLAVYIYGVESVLFQVTQLRYFDKSFCHLSLH